MKIIEIIKAKFIDAEIYYVTTEINQFRYSEMKWEVLIEDCWVEFEDEKLKKILTNEINNN